MIPFLLSVSILFVVHFPARAGEVPFPKGKNCVAWKASKRMFLMGSEEPVGTTCQISVELTARDAGKILVIKVPVGSFESGEPDRDKEVTRLLGGEKFPNIVITSQVIGQELVQRLANGDQVALSAQLEINGKSFKKAFQIKKPNGQPFARISLSTSFSELSIEAPTVAGGLVAKVRDPLELHGQIAVPEELR